MTPRSKLIIVAGAALLTLGIGSAAIALAATPAPEPSQTSPAATTSQQPPPRAIVQPSPSVEPIAEEPVVEAPKGESAKPKPAPPAVVAPPVVEVPAPPAEHPRVQYCAETGYANNGACLDAIPATFSTNSLFRAFTGCKRGAAGIHQIGWGGNSRTGLGFAGPWTASVTGATVQFYLCA